MNVDWLIGVKRPESQWDVFVRENQADERLTVVKNSDFLSIFVKYERCNAVLIRCVFLCANLDLLCCLDLYVDRIDVRCFEFLSCKTRAELNAQS